MVTYTAEFFAEHTNTDGGKWQGGPLEGRGTRWEYNTRRRWFLVSIQDGEAQVSAQPFKNLRGEASRRCPETDLGNLLIRMTEAMDFFVGRYRQLAHLKRASRAEAKAFFLELRKLLDAPL